jgi:hypothetical protein
MIQRGQHRSVRTSGSLVLQLLGGHRNVSLSSGGELRRNWSSIHAVWSAVEADAIAGCALVGHSAVVNVMNDRSVHVRNASVVEVLVASPVATIEPGARVTESGKYTSRV